MQSQQDEASSSKFRGRNPLVIVVVGAVFLFGGLGFWANGTGGSSALDSSPLLFPYTGGSQEVFSAQVRANEAVGPEEPKLVFLQGTSLRAIVPPMAVTPQVLGVLLGETGLNAPTSREIVRYRIEEGDTIGSIAEHFGISTNTILWANDLSSSSAVLRPGEELLVLPVSGALHLIRPGDTLSEVAVWYKADMEDILTFNSLDSAEQILVGDILVIPGGTKPSKLPNGRLAEIGGIFFKPVPSSYKITQGVHPFNAIDFANGSCGGPVYAAAGGTVQVVGYNSGLGNYVRILHANPSGVVTVYAHLSGQAVKTGEKVSQGQTLGYIGHSGRTIPAGPAGCHLHFEVRGATNPFR